VSVFHASPNSDMITFDEPEFLMNPIIHSPCDDGKTPHMMLAAFLV